MGDFNATCSPSEHRGNSFSYYERKANYFSDFIVGNFLLDLGYVGEDLIWCNGQLELSRWWARLD